MGSCEIPELDQAFVQKLAQQVVGTSIADACGFSEMALGQLRIVMQKPQDLESHIFLEFTALACYYDCSGCRTRTDCKAPRNAG